MQNLQAPPVEYEDGMRILYTSPITLAPSGPYTRDSGSAYMPVLIKFEDTKIAATKLEKGPKDLEFFYMNHNYIFVNAQLKSINFEYDMIEITFDDLRIIKK